MASRRPRAVAWQAAAPTGGEACRELVFDGTMDARTFAVDAAPRGSDQLVAYPLP